MADLLWIKYWLVSSVFRFRVIGKGQMWRYKNMLAAFSKSFVVIFWSGWFDDSIFNFCPTAFTWDIMSLPSSQYPLWWLLLNDVSIFIFFTMLQILSSLKLVSLYILANLNEKDFSINHQWIIETLHYFNLKLIEKLTILMKSFLMKASWSYFATGSTFIPE